MDKIIVYGDLLFEVLDVFGNKGRVTKAYWLKIKNEKHRELTFDYTDV